MNIKQIIVCFIILTILFPIAIKADDEIDSIDTNEIEKVVETASSLQEEPKTQARYAVVIDRNSKKILYGKHENEITKMASTTKIMTALIAIENTQLNNVVEISKKAATTGGSRLQIKAGDKITMKDLLYGLLLRSGNDAAVAIAEYVAGSIPNFADRMNQKAIQLGLQNTHFETPHGLDSEKHYTTPYELALLADYALQNEIFSQIVGTKMYSITINGVPRVIYNTNELLGNLSGTYGVKTGFTNGAGRCLVSAVKRENMDIICVVLGADTKKIRTMDSIQLIEYTFRNFEQIDIGSKIEREFLEWKNNNAKNFNIKKGIKNGINITLKEYSLNRYPIKKNEKENIDIKIKANFLLTAPIYQGEKLGTLSVYDENQLILEVEILSKEDIRKKEIGDYLLEFLKNYPQYLKESI